MESKVEQLRVSCVALACVEGEHSVHHPGGVPPREVLLQGARAAVCERPYEGKVPQPSARNVICIAAGGAMPEYITVGLCSVLYDHLRLIRIIKLQLSSTTYTQHARLLVAWREDSQGLTFNCPAGQTLRRLPRGRDHPLRVSQHAHATVGTCHVTQSSHHTP